MKLTALKEFTGADLMVESLHNLGTTDVFGCHGDSMLPFRQAISRKSDLRFVWLKHEQAAVHAADGYARATGKPGIVFISTASGITNGVTGIATAYSDSVPLVVITGQSFFYQNNHDSAEDVCLSGINVPITKHIFNVNHCNEIPTVIQQAYTLAGEGRPGPVLIDLVVIDLMRDLSTINDLFSGMAAISITSDENTGEGEVTDSIVGIVVETISECEGSIQQRNPSTRSRSHSFNKAIQLIEKAKQPVIFIGGGVIISDASGQLRELVKQTRIPVVSSLMGTGAMDSSNPLYLGMVGMHGTFAANKAVHRCDLLVSIGVRFSDRVTGKISGFSPKSQKIHVDIDPAEINKIIEVDLPIVSDAGEFLNYLNETLNVGLVRENCKAWVGDATEWQRTVPRFDKSSSFLKPQSVIKFLSELSSDECIVATDVGQHQIWTAHNFHFTKPRTLLTSGGLGTMGYGFPAAIGAAVSSPNSQIICVTGDGSFQMNLQELLTAVVYQLPIKIAIMNNGYLGMVRQWQEMFYDRRYSSVKMTSPDFVKLASAYGIPSFRASTESEARDVISKAYAVKGPALMEFNVMEEENVYPIVPPNHSNNQLIMSR
jgi:acetolactate synthase I/II/III large subunit